MLREFTKSIGRFEKGGLHDYPKDVWAKLEQAAGMPLDRFTKPAGRDRIWTPTSRDVLAGDKAAGKPRLQLKSKGEKPKLRLRSRD